MRRLFSIALIASLGAGLGWAQSATPPNMPKKPKDLMLLAARVNGLQGIDHPWHVKANYQSFDANGEPKDQGIFEEWWAAPNKYKISYSSPTFNQTRYRMGDNEWTSGDEGWPPFAEAMVQQFLVHPLPAPDVLQMENFSASHKKLGGVALACLQPPPNSFTAQAPQGAALVEEHQINAIDPSQGYVDTSSACLDPKSPEIRIEIFDRAWYAVFNDLIQVDGKYVAKDISAKNGNLPILHVSAVAVDFPAVLADAEFSSPATALPVLVRKARDKVVAGKRIGGHEAEYPQAARNENLQGLVMLRASITTAGTLSDMRIISGPKPLQQAAFDAVKTWRFKPFLLNGQPIEVSTQINVHFGTAR